MDSSMKYIWKPLFCSAILGRLARLEFSWYHFRISVDRLFNVEAPTIDLQSHFRSSYFDLASTRLQTQQPSFVACPLGDNDTRLAFALRAPRVALATPTTAGLCFLPPKPMMPYRHYLPRFLLRRKDLSTILRNRCLALHIPHRPMLRSPALLEALQGCMSTAIGVSSEIGSRSELERVMLGSGVLNRGEGSVWWTRNQIGGTLVKG